MSAPPPAPASLALVPAVLVGLCVALQGAAWGGWVRVPAAGPGRTLFSLVEMALLAALLWNGWRIRSWVRALPGVDARARVVSTLVFASLVLCVLGDAVNRNFGASHYAYDTVIEHSYLADSVWFFLPGYALFIVAAWRACRDRVGSAVRWGSLGVGALAGAATFGSIVLPGTSPYVVAMTGSYSVLISLMVPVALWIVLAFGRPASAVAAGAVLATVADALIGQFWLFGHGHHPGIAYLNFIVYFASQALIQRFPLVVSAGDPGAGHDRDIHAGAGRRP
ncbi:MAG: hypothetical protein Q8P18_13795 [Pseudomonadota bacterium]|nr:hypothetical protein [Pseudomonadota bacterium]